MFSVEGIFLWLSGEIKWWFLIGFLIGTALFCIKRAWIGFSLFALGSCFIGMFVINPQIMLTLPEKLSKLLNLGA
ncbi:hypothetical protein COL23_25660 [Priestia aryabhattai]|uniref:hypothetical protein n=1 Tax=Priestia aryabhattai TaxID=412384 RepID=UPI000BF7B6DE|nr:hypothetical protein [Priestia aryabhattai]PFW72140.1 hypothetical protein COL23_25660 [Priestia aryabhattai]